MTLSGQMGSTEICSGKKIIKDSATPNTTIPDCSHFFEHFFLCRNHFWDESRACIDITPILEANAFPAR